MPKISAPESLSDLRPISILPAMAKVCERVLEKQLKAYVQKYNIISQYQSGFRTGYSCETALLEVTDNIFSSLDENKFVLLVLLDFSKAFDTVNHEILLAILQHIGLTHNSLALMSSYLRNRMQTVHLDNNYSQPAEESLGVPQGSVLAPMLFSIYTHAFSKVIKHGTFHFYADESVAIYFYYR